MIKARPEPLCMAEGMACKAGFKDGSEGLCWDSRRDRLCLGGWETERGCSQVKTSHVCWSRRRKRARLEARRLRGAAHKWRTVAGFIHPAHAVGLCVLHPWP